MDLRLLRYFVAVAEERHIGRAATKLHMTQPPLSRAVRQLEMELGATLLHRTSTGVTLTAAGTILYDEARVLLEQAEQVRSRVTASTRPATLTVGVLADSAEQIGDRLAAAFRQHYPYLQVRVREANLNDPTAGLRTGLVDVALTRAPFQNEGVNTQPLRSDPVGVVLRADDPLARRDRLHVCELDDRQWFQFPDGTDPVWCAYWNAAPPDGRLRQGPVVRTVHECLQAVLWNGTIGLTPLVHTLPDGLVAVPLVDQPPSLLVVAWRTVNADPLVRLFVRLAVATYRQHNG